MYMVYGGGLAAQTSTGTITGLVQDSAGAALPNASVKLTLTANGTTRETKTSDSGAFTAPVLPPGVYAVTVTAQGFSEKTLRDVTLLVDQTLNVNISMEVGDVSQTVTVEAAPALVDSETSSLGQVVEEKQILSMPLNGRNPYQLGLLVGNTVQLFGVGSNLPFVAGGGRFTAVDVSLDGVDNNTITNAGAIGRTGIAIVPSVDAVQEFKVNTNNFPAEFGHAAGSVVNTTLKSGSNQFHGVFFEFLRNNAFDANNYITKLAGLPRAPFHQNQFGATLGGPVLRKKLFFFIDYQGTRQTTRAASNIINLPPLAFRTGDFSGTYREDLRSHDAACAGQWPGGGDPVPQQQDSGVDVERYGAGDHRPDSESEFWSNDGHFTQLCLPGTAILVHGCRRRARGTIRSRLRIRCTAASRRPITPSPQWACLLAFWGADRRLSTIPCSWP